MAGLHRPIRLVRCPAPVAAIAGARLVLPALSLPTAARGPDGIADVSEQVIEAVVNISTSQKVEARSGARNAARCRPGSPFEEFFEEFFKNRRGAARARMPPIAGRAG